jgi:CII-binding regulator of phage lambda lysogenization HflD
MPTLPYSSTDLQEVSTRNDHARRIVAGFASAMPAIADIWQDIAAALDDTAALSADITWLSAELRDTRLDRANLLAAIRAALAAHADGEPDPMCYLRDELDAAETPATVSRRQA